ncbi:MAG TPA: TlyA family rRNA (cytidine-2'-O)-methyltransferase [Ktedonobacter sp.]|nr:TlyA family rRNA (cytidine-2'-O)-methyltransferase [Ktedonobacter sp.]HAT43472.1 TlyA family rRNA (cytidine-2'-O)-methyltransferase [Ktedonobacter sp.]HCF86132.1 TlyA family rRNA (cytidine-2'-O)-methyltransferase [Ktedonobacter sp.]
MSKPRKVRRAPRCQLDALLAERGIFESVEEARPWIMTGQVLVNEQLIDKPGMLVPADAILRVRGRHRYASRGGYKLEAALEYFQVNVAGRVALDSGASTGGFTDCLLQHGASLVYAVEVGHGQLVGRLRADARVRNLERTNLSDLVATVLQPPPTLITLDLSYLSLTKALPIAASLVEPGGQVLSLLKPLFEVESAEARRSGQVDDPALLVSALCRVLDVGAATSLVPLGAAKLALKPRHGVTEFFVSFVRDTSQPCWRYNETTLLGIVEGPGIGRSEED